MSKKGFAILLLSAFAIGLKPMVSAYNAKGQPSGLSIWQGEGIGKGRALLLQFFAQAMDRQVVHSVSHCNLLHWKQRFADCTASSSVRGEFTLRYGGVSAISKPLVTSCLACNLHPCSTIWILHFVAALFDHKPCAFQDTASYPMPDAV